MFKLLLTIFTVTSLFSFLNVHMESNTVKLHEYRQINSSVLKEIPDNKLNNRFGNKESYKIQFKEDNYYQVEKTYKENRYGSTKETLIYFSKGEDNYLVSTKEYTNDNIISNKNDLSYSTKIDNLPFIKK